MNSLEVYTTPKAPSYFDVSIHSQELFLPPPTRKSRSSAHMRLDCCYNGYHEHCYTASPNLDFDLCIDPRLRYDTSSSRVITSVGNAANAGPATDCPITASIITSDSSTPWNSAIGSPTVALCGRQTSSSDVENEGLSAHNIDDMFSKLVEWKGRYLSPGNPTNSGEPPYFSTRIQAANVNPHTETTDAMSTKLAEWKRRYLTSENSQQPIEPACFPSPSLPTQVDFVAQSVDRMSSRLAEWKSRYQTQDNSQKPAPLLTFPVPTLPVIPVDEIAESVQNMYSKLVDWKHRYLTPENSQNMIRPPLLSPISLPEQGPEIPRASDQAATESQEPVEDIHSAPVYIYEPVEPTRPSPRPPSSQRTKHFGFPELQYITFAGSGILPDEDRENLGSTPTELSHKSPESPAKQLVEIENLSEHEVILGLIRPLSPFSSSVTVQHF